MNIKWIIGCTATLNVFTGIACSNREANDIGHDHHHESEHVDHSHNDHHSHDRDEHEAHTSDVIVLSPDRATEFGVEATVINGADFSEVLKVTGICETAVKDFTTAVAPTTGIISFNANTSLGQSVSKGAILGTVSAAGMVGGDANENARIAFEIAQKELERVKPLHADGIVSTRDYNTVEAEYKRAKAALGSVAGNSNIITRSSGVISELFVTDGAFVEQGTPVATITSNESLIVRAEVPVRYSQTVKSIADANLIFSGIDSVYTLASLGGKQVSNVAGKVTNGYLPIFFEIASDGNIINGMPVEIFLKGKKRENVLSVPLSAISEQQGVTFIYEKLDDDCYRKLPVVLGNSDGSNVEILRGLEPGKEIITKGTLFVRLAESSGAVPEGHTHNH